MKVRNVISLAAANLGREDLVAQANNCAAEPTGELASLLRCYNLVENEVALDYFPLTREETFSAKEGVVPFSEFSDAPVEIRKVTGAAPLSFRCRETELVLSEKAETVTVEYAYVPKEKEWGDDGEFHGKISERLLSYGVCTEYCLSCGRYDEAAMWEKRYREALRAANILRRKLAVRSRRWA